MEKENVNVKIKNVCLVQDKVYHIDLCISCNEEQNYFPKFNDTNNYNSFINCYTNLENYYLKDNIYNPCYGSCQTM